MKPMFRTLVTAIVSSGVLNASLLAQNCSNQICLIDRGATGEIDLGMIRGGLAVLDYDLDGYPDLVIADNQGLANRLFRNQPDGLVPGKRTFVDVTVGSGLDDDDGRSRSSFAVAAGDFDNDGDSDIFLSGIQTGATPNGLLYRNDAGHFVNISESSGIRPGCYHRAASWTDYDLDGWIDLFVVCNDSNATDYILHHNNRDGTFTPQPGRLPPTVASLGISYSHMWTDFDDDGYDDGIILSTLDPPILLKNVADELGGRRLVDVAAAVGFDVLGPAPMGIAAGDYDNDGDFDFAVTDAAVGTYYENVGGQLVEVFPFETDFSWGITWLDVDNDGDLDHYQCGALGAYPRFDSLIRNLGGGQWEDISPALNGISASSQHSVQIDYNNDGRQDLITINPGSPPSRISVYENISATQNHWLGIRLQGDGVAVNSDAIGAVARVTAGGLTQIRQVQSGSSTTSTEDLRLHFGIGQNTIVDRIEVRWPAQGTLEDRTDVYLGPFNADQFLTLTPRTSACCVCPDSECMESTLAGCRAQGGRRLGSRACGAVDCAVEAPLVAKAPTAVQDGDPLNRYVGFVPANPGRSTAIKVTLESLNHPGTGPAGSDFSEYEGQSLWVGAPAEFVHATNPPRTFHAAQLQCSPEYRDWGGFGTVYIYGREFIPSSLYRIEEFDGTCGIEGAVPSEALWVGTARWGDVVAPFNPPSATTQPDFTDVSAIVSTFRNAPYAAGKTRSQLVPSPVAPGEEVNFSDIAACVDAFRGVPYPLGGPTIECPP